MSRSRAGRRRIEREIAEKVGVVASTGAGTGEQPVEQRRIGAAR